MAPKAKTPEQSEYLTKAEAAELLGVTIRQVERLVQSGKLTPYTRPVGRNRVFFRRDEIERLHTPTPASK